MRGDEDAEGYELRSAPGSNGVFRHVDNICCRWAGSRQVPLKDTHPPRSSFDMLMGRVIHKLWGTPTVHESKTPYWNPHPSEQPHLPRPVIISNANLPDCAQPGDSRASAAGAQRKARITTTFYKSRNVFSMNWSSALIQRVDPAYRKIYAFGLCKYSVFFQFTTIDFSDCSSMASLARAANEDCGIWPSAEQFFLVWQPTANSLTQAVYLLHASFGHTPQSSQ